MCHTKLFMNMILILVIQSRKCNGQKNSYVHKCKEVEQTSNVGDEPKNQDDLKKNLPISSDRYVVPNSQGPIDPHPSPVGSLTHDLVRNLEIRKGRKRSVEEQGRFSPKEEDDYEEEEGIRDNRQEAVSGPIE